MEFVNSSKAQLYLSSRNGPTVQILLSYYLNITISTVALSELVAIKIIGLLK